MSRDPYRSPTRDHFGGRGSGSQRWDSERFAMERDRARFEERESRMISRGPGGRVRERSVDEIYERRGPRGYEDERFESRRYYDEEPRYSPRPERERVTIEKERVREREYSPSPPRRAPARPSFLRRQSSLDTFDRKPLTRYVDREREEYGPPARYREELPRPVPLTPIPLPRTRALPPPRRYEKEYYEDIEVAEPDFYGDDRYHGYPERVREREIIRKKRRSHSRESRMSRSVKSSVRSSSTSSSGSSATAVSVRSEFPKKGKTRMPARLVSKQAITDLGYLFEEEGEVIIIQKALGRENIDEVIKLSEDYKSQENVETVIEKTETVVEVPEPAPVAAPAPPPPPPAPEPAPVEIIKESRTVEYHDGHHHHGHPVIVNASPGPEYVEAVPVGPLALALPHHSRAKDERAIRAEIRALEAEKEALRAEKRAEREMRKADRIRREGAGEVVLYERERSTSRGEETTIIRKERIEEVDGGVRIEKDKKGRMSISVPKYYR